MPVDAAVSKQRRWVDQLLSYWADNRAVVAERLGWSGKSVAEGIRTMRDHAGASSKPTMDERGDPLLTLPELHAQIHSKVQRCEAIVDSMPDEWRVVVTMFYVDHLNRDKIAERLNIEVKAVRYRLSDLRDYFFRQYRRREDGINDGE